MTMSAAFRWLMICFIVGVGIESFVQIPIVFILLVGMSALIVCAWAWRRDQKNFVVYALCVLGLFVGIVRMNEAAQHAPELSALSQHYIAVSGVIAQDPKFSDKSQRLLLNVDNMLGDNLASPIPLLIVVQKYPVYQQGDIIRAQGMFEAKLYDGVAAGTMFSIKEEKIGEKPMPLVLRWMRRAKTAFDAHIDKALPEPHASFMKGLLLGEKTSMPADLLNEFKQAGVSHIVALSGYNITIVGTLFVDILLMFTIPFWLTFWLAGASIIFFVLLTGAAASLIRAAIMGILVLIAMREGRMYHMTNALLCAGACMLAVNPYLLGFDAGFQLSFLATLGLIYFTAPVERALTKCEYRIWMLFGKKRIAKEENRFVHGIKKIMSETIAAQCAVLPLLVFLFGGVSLVAPISNLFVLVAVPLTMAFGFFTGMAGFVAAPLSIVFGWCAWILLEYELIMIHIFSRVPFSFVSVSSGGMIGVVLGYSIVFMRWWSRKREP